MISLFNVEEKEVVLKVLVLPKRIFPLKTNPHVTADLQCPPCARIFNLKWSAGYIIIEIVFFIFFSPFWLFFPLNLSGVQLVGKAPLKYPGVRAVFDCVWPGVVVDRWLLRHGFELSATMQLIV